ncbi:MAG: hypothetical protein QNJ60_11655 [Xenococcaceae cyanobacterium MO_188.B19]|nr:hypothetical protein [Xenococcaceae cyanobacterium MO_188.B19]
MAVHEIVLDVPNSKANARLFGYPVSLKGTKAAFVKVPVVLQKLKPKPMSFKRWMS